jgi:phospholipase/carboxylesterase
MTGENNLGFVHRFEPAQDKTRPPLLLLHGTGGNESDLIPLGLQLSPGAALLAPRGRVSENGMPRFFKRRAEGVFDVEDLNARTDELAEFVAAARKTYSLEQPIAVGFSNGANIAWSLLLNHPGALKGAILIRGMLPFDPPPGAKLNGVPVLMLNGSNDPIVPTDTRDRLARALKDAGADLRDEILPAGHQLTRQDLAIAAEWLAQR